MSKTIEPPARRLLFLPGAGADPSFWRPLGDRLPAAWAKHYFGWPGLGDQPHDPPVASLDDLIAMVEAELGDAPIDLLAQSMGGLVAMSVALRNPGRVRRLVLTVTSGGVDAMRNVEVDWRETYQRNFPNALSWVRDVRVDLTDQIPSIPCSTLLIWGAADPISPVRVGERLRDLLPNARLRVVADAGHDVVRTHAAELAPLIEWHIAAHP